MRPADDVLVTLADVDRRIGLMASAQGTAGIVEAVRAYLAAWPKQRILAVQKVDGGWGPFDTQQQPVAVRGPDHIVSMSESVRRQVRALREAGMEPTPEFLELDLFFFLARQVVEGRRREQAAARKEDQSGAGYYRKPGAQDGAHRAS